MSRLRIVLKLVATVEFEIDHNLAWPQDADQIKGLIKDGINRKVDALKEHPEELTLKASVAGVVEYAPQVNKN